MPTLHIRLTTRLLLWEAMADSASIFISYSHADKDLAHALADELRGLGLAVWIDEGELKVGDSLIERIAAAIAEIDFFLALVSEDSRNSRWCRKELALAVTGELGREGVKVLPVRVDGAPIPEALRDVYYLDLNRENVGKVAAKITEAVPRHQAEAEQAKQDQGQARSRRAATPSNSVFSSEVDAAGEYEPIKIVGIVEEGVGTPRNDGTRGCAVSDPSPAQPTTFEHMGAALLRDLEQTSSLDDDAPSGHSLRLRRHDHP